MHFFLIYAGNILAVKQNLSVCALIKVDNGTPKRRFSAAGFSHNAHCFSSPDGKGNVVYRVQRPLRGIKIFFQMFYFY